jgi:hypothetical protein
MIFDDDAAMLSIIMAFRITIIKHNTKYQTLSIEDAE